MIRKILTRHTVKKLGVVTGYDEPTKTMSCAFKIKCELLLRVVTQVFPEVWHSESIPPETCADPVRKLTYSARFSNFNSVSSENALFEVRRHVLCDQYWGRCLVWCSVEYRSVWYTDVKCLLLRTGEWNRGFSILSLDCVILSWSRIISTLI